MGPGLNTMYTPSGPLFTEEYQTFLYAVPLPYHSFGGLHSLPVTNSDTGPEVELQKEEAPVSLRNHCHLAPLAPISLGPRDPKEDGVGVSAIWSTAMKILEKENKLKKRLFLNKSLADIWQGWGQGAGVKLADG